MHVTYSSHLELALIRPQYVIASCLQQSTPLHLQSSIHVAESPALSEVVDEVQHPKLHQQIIDLLTVAVLSLPKVSVEVP